MRRNKNCYFDIYSISKSMRAPRNKRDIIFIVSQTYKKSKAMCFANRRAIGRERWIIVRKIISSTISLAFIIFIFVCRTILIINTIKWYTKNVCTIRVDLCLVDFFFVCFFFFSYILIFKEHGQEINLFKVSIFLNETRSIGNGNNKFFCFVDQTSSEYQNQKSRPNFY